MLIFFYQRWAKGKGKERATTTDSAPAEQSTMEADDTHDDVGDHPYSAKMADVELTQTSETNTNFKPVDWNAVPFVEDDSVYEDETSMSQDYEMDVDKDTVTDETQVQQNED